MVALRDNIGSNSPWQNPAQPSPETTEVARTDACQRTPLPTLLMPRHSSGAGRSVNPARLPASYQRLRTGRRQVRRQFRIPKVRNKRHTTGLSEVKYAACRESRASSDKVGVAVRSCFCSMRRAAPDGAGSAQSDSNSDLNSGRPASVVWNPYAAIATTITRPQMVLSAYQAETSLVTKKWMTAMLASDPAATASRPKRRSSQTKTPYEIAAAAMSTARLRP